MDKDKEPLEEFTDEQKEVLESIKISRVILPIVIGIGVVIYLFWKQFDPAEFAKINWTTHTLFWILLAVLILIIRHLAYAARLRILSEKAFSWKKCIELIFIWEFSSAVSPTSLGGSAVAFFVLAQEKLSTAKTATIVLYTIVLDTFFFIFSLLGLFLIFGTSMIRPGMENLQDIDGWGWTFISAYLLMFVYGSLFAYGLFVNPKQIKNILVWFTNFGFLKKYKKNATDIGNDMITASKELGRQKFSFHISAFLATATAWSGRFLLLNCLIIAIVETVSIDVMSQLGLYARLEAMFVIMAFSPTPGGAGFAEVVFGGFLSDYVPKGISLIIASIWRLLTYYSYLIIGVIIIPNWIRNIMNERRKRKNKDKVK